MARDAIFILRHWQTPLFDATCGMKLGLDFGTSGARAAVLDSQHELVFETALPYSASGLASVAAWDDTLHALLQRIPAPLCATIKAVAIAGTSGTCLICDDSGAPTSDVLVYDDARATREANRIAELAPAGHITRSATSTLAKLLWLIPRVKPGSKHHLEHHADYVGFLLHGQVGLSDYHNALKLGFDPELMRYGGWIDTLGVTAYLPKVFIPGEPIAAINPQVAQRYGFAPDCIVCAGTTDSIAAFLACGAKEPGSAVTSLGSTLVLKLLSEQRIDQSDYGIYSHRLGDLWLAGGASNSGGNVLRAFFSDDDLERLSANIDPDKPSGLDYYPLLRAGERFPHNDPAWRARLNPRPDDPEMFLHGLLEGMARIEAKGYALLAKLGATPVRRVYTAGGGARNETWRRIRERYLGVPVLVAKHTEAAYGAALLANLRR